MSLLSRATDVVTVFAETVVTDDDGNTITRPGTVGIVTRAVVQPINTVAANGEDDDGTSQKLRMRLVGWNGPQLGAQSAVDWNGKLYALDGDPMVYNSSRRTAHVDYRLIRK